MDEVLKEFEGKLSTKSKPLSYIELEEIFRSTMNAKKNT